MPIHLRDGQKKALEDKIEAYYQKEYGEPMGLIRRDRLMSLFFEELGPIIYNRALDDAQRWAAQMLGNLETDYILLYKRVD